MNQTNKARNRYTNEALEFYNKLRKRKILSAKLEKETKLVKEESLKVLNEFEPIIFRLQQLSKAKKNPA
jgi:hypothetical protein